MPRPPTASLRPCQTAWVFLLTILVALAACAAPPPASRTAPGSERTPEHKAVVEVLEACYRELSAREWEAFGAHFWPAAQLASIWQAQGQERPEVNWVTIEEFVERAPQGPGSQPIYEQRLLGAEVRVSGSLAQVWALWEARFGREGELTTLRGLDSVSLLRQDGRWRIISVAFQAADG